MNSQTMTKKFIVNLIILSLFLISTSIFAAQIAFNRTDLGLNKDNARIAEIMKDLDKASGKNDKKEYNVNLEQEYKIYCINWKGIVNNEIHDLDSAVVDYGLYQAVFITDDKLDGASALYEYNSNSNVDPKLIKVSKNEEALRLSKFYNNVIKNKKFEDLKVIIHPSSDTNKLFYITEKNRTYVIPVLLKEKEFEVGLTSYQEYTPEEIYANIKGYLNKVMELYQVNKTIAMCK